MLCLQGGSVLQKVLATSGGLCSLAFRVLTRHCKLKSERFARCARLRDSTVSLEDREGKACGAGLDLLCFERNGDLHFHGVFSSAHENSVNTSRTHRALYRCLS